MKAVIYEKYGSPDYFELKEVEKPVPQKNEVLIAVHAASINSWDLAWMYGKPYVLRIGGMFTPRFKTIGCDVSGRVEAVGRDVTKFKPGDDVFGDLSACGWGGFAEYVCGHENAVVKKPDSMTYEQAAALPQAGVLALQGLDKRQINPGDKVLINGAGGGVGTIGIPIAKSMGAEVTGVDTGAKFDLMKSAGADHVIDYTKEDFTKNGRTYDLILDNEIHRSFFDCRRAVAPGGTYAVLGGATSGILQVLLLGALSSKFSSKKMGLLLHKPMASDLERLINLFKEDVVKPVIDRSYPLGETGEALRYYATGEVRGKIIITTAHLK